MNDRIGTKTLENGLFDFHLGNFFNMFVYIEYLVTLLYSLGLLQMGLWYCIVGDLYAR